MLTYRALLVFLQYMTPLSIISVVYARMARTLWGSKAPGNAEDSRDATFMKNKKKVFTLLYVCSYEQMEVYRQYEISSILKILDAM